MWHREGGSSAGKGRGELYYRYIVRNRRRYLAEWEPDRRGWVRLVRELENVRLIARALREPEGKLRKARAVVDGRGDEVVEMIASVARRDLVRRRAALMRAPFLAGVSQIVGVAQIYLLTRNHGSGHASDAYFFLFNASQLPIQILLLGFAYPVVLNSRGDGETRLVRRLRLITPPACVLTVGAAAVWLESQTGLSDLLYLLVLLSLVNGFFSALVWQRAVQLAAVGEPLWLAASVLPANVGACIFIANAWSPASLRAVLMTAGLVAGNACLYLYLRARELGAPPSRERVAEAPTGRVGNLWYLGKAILSYAGANLIQALTLLLPASSVTILNIVLKVSSAPPTVLVNALLPHFVHRGTDDKRAAVRFAWAMTLLLTPVFVVALIAWLGLDGQILRYVLLGAAWMIPACLSNIAHRVAYRFLAPSASVWSVITTVTIVLLLIVLSQTSLFSLTVVLVASMALDAVPGACLWWTLGDRGLSACCLAPMVVTVLAVWHVV